VPGVETDEGCGGEQLREHPDQGNSVVQVIQSFK